MALDNETRVKSSMTTQDYKLVNAHDCEISGWTILSRLLHAHTPNLGGISVDVQNDLFTPAFKNGEQLKYFRSRTF